MLQLGAPLDLPFANLLNTLPDDVFLTGSRFFTQNFTNSSKDWDWYTVDSEETRRLLKIHGFREISHRNYVGSDPTISKIFRRNTTDIQLIDPQYLKIKHKTQEKMKEYAYLPKPARNAIWRLIISYEIALQPLRKEQNENL